MSQSTSRNFEAYAAAIRERESSGDYRAVNRGGYAGAYQMGKPALIDAGFLDRNGNWTSYAQSLGVNSLEAFKNSQQAQDIAFRNFTRKNWDYLRNYKHYVGQTVGGIPVTMSGMLAGAHLVGSGDVKRFLDSNGASVPRDGNKTLVTEYMKRFGGYEFDFDANHRTPETGRAEGHPFDPSLVASSGNASRTPSLSFLQAFQQYQRAAGLTSSNALGPAAADVTANFDGFGPFNKGGWATQLPRLTYAARGQAAPQASGPGSNANAPTDSGPFGTGGQFVPGSATSSRPLYGTQSPVPPPDGPTSPDATDDSKPVRRLGARIGDRRGATVFDLGAPAVPFVPQNPIAPPSGPATFDERFQAASPLASATPAAASPDDDLDAFRRRWAKAFLEA